MSTWTKLKRKGGAKPDRTPLVSIRRQAIALNAQFVAQASLDDFTRVSVFVDADRFRIGLQFHNETRDEDSFALTTDGGGRGKGRSFQVTGLMKEYPWIEAVSRVEDKRLRRFGPEWISADSKWVISLCPAFEHRVSDKSNIPSDVRGIYRYRREDEIVYIGRGQVRSRLNARHRKDWDFETIEYSVVPDETEQEKWEAYWLDKFEELHGKLPIYNCIAGTRGRRDGDNNG